MCVFLHISLSFAVYSECDINVCQNGGLCKKLGVSYICECMNGFSGSSCQTGMLITCICIHIRFGVKYMSICI